MNRENAKQGTQKLHPDELTGVSGGSAISTEEVKEWECPTIHANAIRTGRERSVPFFFFWHRRQREYRCPDCGYKWWKDEA